jgi:hypothetical protein
VDGLVLDRKRMPLHGLNVEVRDEDRRAAALTTAWDGVVGSFPSLGPIAYEVLFAFDICEPSGVPIMLAH